MPGVWIEFKYRDPVRGNIVGHTCHVNSNEQLSGVMDRYNLEPAFLHDIKRNGREITAMQLSKVLYGGVKR